MYDYVCNRISRLQSRHVKGPVWRIDSGRHIKIYYIVDDGGYPASWLYLQQKTGWVAWEVAQVWTFPAHRGQKHAELLYKAAINTDGILLASGNLHTQYSMAMWRSFVRRGLFNVWAQDFKKLERTSVVDFDSDENAIDCALPIYEQPKGYRRPRTDVRLLAIRKDTR